MSIIGAGLMGTGIANVTLKPDLMTNIFDNNSVNLDKSVNKIYKSISKQKSQGRIDLIESDKLKLNLSSNNNFANSDIIIEAVSEDMSIKESIFNILDQETSPLQF